MKRLTLLIWGYAILLACLTSLPYIVGEISTPDGWGYSGAAVLPDGAKVDYYSHMAKMWQGARGQFAYQLLFTHEAHTTLPTVQGFYVALGAMSQLANVDFAFSYHLMRFILTVGMVWAIWMFMSRYLKTLGERWVALFFATIVFGWSWLLFFIAPEMTMQPEGTPIELWLLDAYNLLGGFIMPHFAAAVILQIVVFLVFDKWLRSGDVRSIITLTIALMLDAIIQPYVVLMMVFVVGIITAYSVFIERTLTFKKSLVLLIPLIAHVGVVLFQYVMISNDPIWSNFTAQNQTLSPPIIYYLLGYLPFLIPIVLGIKFIAGRLRGDTVWLLPFVWVVVVLLLLYAPLPTQRRYLLGVQTPVALFAALGWYHVVLVRIAESWRPFANIPYLTLGALGLVLVLFANISGLANPSTASGVFYNIDEVNAGQWIQENTPIDSLILTTFDWDTSGNGGKVVGLTGRRVFAGHWIETAQFEDKRQQLIKFYDPITDDEWRLTFLNKTKIDYIWYDESIRSSFGTWHPMESDYLDGVFIADTVQIYLVDGEGG